MFFRLLRLPLVTLPNGVSREGRGGSLSHTALCSEGGGYGRKDGDEDVEDFTPGGVVVESSHSVKGCFEG